MSFTKLDERGSVMACVYYVSYIVHYASLRSSDCTRFLLPCLLLSGLAKVILLTRFFVPSWVMLATYA
jgi:hypothetical protein